MTSETEVIVDRLQLLRFAKTCMAAAGTEEKHAQIMADNLVMADYRGHHSHGLRYLNVYTEEVRQGICCGGEKEPAIVKETVATALVDGNNLLGPVVGKFSMELAIQKAKTTGIGFVTTKGSNHFGMAGWYSLIAIEHGLLGIALTNTTPLLVPTRAKRLALGTNPISVAASGKHGDSFVLDIATSSVAFGKVDMCDINGVSTPSVWGVDGDGNETTDPKKIEGLLPLGGFEENGGYKGYGLCMMVEILCAMLSGSAFGPFFSQQGSAANMGHCFIAIDPKAFEDGFVDRMSRLLDTCCGLDSVNKERPVLVPGDPEKVCMRRCDELGGIPYHPNEIKLLIDVADRLQVPRLQPL